MTHPEQPPLPDDATALNTYPGAEPALLPRLPEPQADGQPQPAEPVENRGGPASDAPRRLDLPHSEWRRVSPKYVVVDLLGYGITAALVLIAALVMHVALDQRWIWWAAGPFLAVCLISGALAPRRIRSIGYQLRDDDLLFRRGIMWQRLVAVPYGRMQLIDINRGPVARAYGLAELKFVTASTATGIVLPGLPVEEAEQLRDHLVAVAESRRTGL
ncbi:membrane protein YdbS with pleckstrin-like domain [Okibacterium sp. HSC-33S16]|uniref:PH domain-containing protein n=1 Tax=Okibacterium sp. HSC-33S16 TaxID=2910965 RepID=UPI00209D0539|nr:PH domain-containing protein [Okibacterium sp. HSC-33S16]MCP2031582.1 membrane protein YdbS with pleckstrin-like domain [Okibacterium sp. HSC-33S16]